MFSEDTDDDLDFHYLENYKTRLTRSQNNCLVSFGT